MPAEPRIDEELLRIALTRGPVSTSVLAEQFGVSRQAILKRLEVLERRALAVRSGAGRAARWSAPSDVVLRWSLRLEAGDEPDEDTMWTELRSAATDLLADANGNTLRALQYGLTEMLNNAIDHSTGTEVWVAMSRVDDDVVVGIDDDGIGAFPNVRAHFDLPTIESAAAHISKGRQTTAPEAHTGQGLFFTSKAFDEFEISSAGVAWRVDNGRDDQALVQVADRRGTHVTLRTSLASRRVLGEVFARFADEDTNDFDRSIFRVALVDIAREFVSRSEAKRIGAGLDVYERVQLDFRGVAGVGQGFVDELFRVWVRAHPATELVPINMNDTVRFMVERGLPDTA
ncbi:MAG TPA: DUF4325 domain-containing protein [Acidimicrobiales bacterium]|nr:DUF4325 domain-containing protein [Acidimicrobiales bacterium]